MNQFFFVLRYTLLLDTEAVNEGISSVDDALKSLTSADQIIDSFEGMGDQNKVVRRLLHYEA